MIVIGTLSGKPQQEKEARSNPISFIARIVPSW